MELDGKPLLNTTGTHNQHKTPTSCDRIHIGFSSEALLNSVNMSDLGKLPVHPYLIFFKSIFCNNNNLITSAEILVG